MYRFLVKPLVYLLPKRRSRGIILGMFSFCARAKWIQILLRLFFHRKHSNLKKEVFGIKFSNPLGLSGGIDRDAQIYNIMDDIGFGFVEIGPVTPLPQNSENIKSAGVKAVIENIKRVYPDIILIADITKNLDSEGDKIIKDYSHVFSMLYDFADIFVLHISGEQESSVSGQQEVNHISDIVDEILESRMTMDIEKPVLLRIPPDTGEQRIDDILDFVRLSGLDGVVVGGTDDDRRLVKSIHDKTDGRLIIVARSDIKKPREAAELIDAGASLIGISSALTSRGPSFIRKTNNYLSANSSLKC